MLTVCATLLVGLQRWRDTHAIFLMPDADAFAHFGAVGVSLQAGLLGVVLFATAFGYVIVGANNDVYNLKQGIIFD